MNKIELLWLWYDYYTEMHDQQLRNVPSPNDEGSVIVIGHHQSLSNKYAYSLSKNIYTIADYYGIPRELMNEEKLYRGRQSTKRRIELFEWVREEIPHELKFIDDYNVMIEQEQKVKLFQSKVYDLFKT